MSAILLLLCLSGNPAPIETRFVQVHPVPKTAPPLQRSPAQNRAVVLIHGLRVHPLQSSRIAKPHLHSWQEPGSALVKTLAKDADVFAFAYGQNAAVDAVAQAPALIDALGSLKKFGYEEIVVIGHSAGGVIARLFVEDHPRAGVTKVIQVCAPNEGTPWARADVVRNEQEPFLLSLTKAQRQFAAQRRAAKTLPEHVQFLCVVGTTTGTHGDGVIARASQWPVDLQRQGIPAVLVATTHFTVMRSSKVAERLAEFVRSPHARWSLEQRLIMQKQILNGAGK